MNILSTFTVIVTIFCNFETNLEDVILLMLKNKP
jgi:hypothetical protein